MIKRLSKCVLFVMLLTLVACQSVQAKGKGKAKAAEKTLDILIVLGEHEYGTDHTVPAFAETVLKPLGQTVTVIKATDMRTKMARDQADFPGLTEAIKKADVILISVRRRQIITEAMAALKEHLAQGKGLVTLRTAVTPFQTIRPKKGRTADGKINMTAGKLPPLPEGYARWQDFTYTVLACSYDGHENNAKYRVYPAPEAKDHPIIKGVTYNQGNKLYRTHPLLSEHAKPVLLGYNEKMKRDESVVWTNLYGPKHARIVGIAAGTEPDMHTPTFDQLLTNSIYWAAGRTAPLLKKKK